MTDKKVRTPRNADAILAGAVKLPLNERVKLLKALNNNINEEVAALQAAATEASKMVGG